MLAQNGEVYELLTRLFRKQSDLVIDELLEALQIHPAGAAHGVQVPNRLKKFESLFHGKLLRFLGRCFRSCLFRLQECVRRSNLLSRLRSGDHINIRLVREICATVIASSLAICALNSGDLLSNFYRGCLLVIICSVRRSDRSFFNCLCQLLRFLGRCFLTTSLEILILPLDYYQPRNSYSASRLLPA